MVEKSSYHPEEVWIQRKALIVVIDIANGNDLGDDAIEILCTLA
jgi:hypothetical protein